MPIHHVASGAELVASHLVQDLVACHRPPWVRREEIKQALLERRQVHLRAFHPHAVVEQVYLQFTQVEGSGERRSPEPPGSLPTAWTPVTTKNSRMRPDPQAVSTTARL